MRLRLTIALALALPLLAACGPADDSGETADIPDSSTATGADATPLPEGDGTRENPYVGRGFISEIGTGELVINHETIPGFMAAMQMAFPVSDDVDLSEFEVGDRVMFDVEAAGDFGYQIFHVEPAED